MRKSDCHIYALPLSVIGLLIRCIALHVRVRQDCRGRGWSVGAEVDVVEPELVAGVGSGAGAGAAGRRAEPHMTRWSWLMCRRRQLGDDARIQRSIVPRTHSSL